LFPKVPAQYTVTIKYTTYTLAYIVVRKYSTKIPKSTTMQTDDFIRTYYVPYSYGSIIYTIVYLYIHLKAVA
jgi:hypothetical protein